MQRNRAMTLALFELIPDDIFSLQAHADFSPVGWHLGHIGYTESCWILAHLAGQPCNYPQYQQLFAADGLPKHQRQQLPDRDTILAYLQDIRAQVEVYLQDANIHQQSRWWHFLLQHESQHCETIAIVLALLGQVAVYPQQPATATADPSPMIQIPAGGFWQGMTGPMALDNEQPAHWVELPDYWIDATPVTCAQYQEFIAAGGYRNPQWWSSAGWRWQQQQAHQQPHYWPPEPAESHYPVCGVSWYEATAYARFVGKRLPTEAEWEKAARWNGQQSQHFPWGETWQHALGPHSLFQGCDRQPSERANLSGVNLRSGLAGTTPVTAYPNGRSPYRLWDCLGNVWEWTDSWFRGYPQFAAFPYAGYSQAYFDDQHRVLRGGSWATRPWSIRASFRNWYHPEARVIFAGFRCARDSAPD
jgi:ergothioneine biosynthesis protein EgtB